MADGGLGGQVAGAERAPAQPRVCRGEAHEARRKQGVCRVERGSAEMNGSGHPVDKNTWTGMRHEVGRERCQVHTHVQISYAHEGVCGHTYIQHTYSYAHTNALMRNIAR